MGTYLWVEVDNLKRLEAKIAEGPLHPPLRRHSRQRGAGAL